MTEDPFEAAAIETQGPDTPPESQRFEGPILPPEYKENLQAEEIRYPDVNIYSPGERKKMEHQEAAAVIYSLMDTIDRRLLQFFSLPHLKCLVLCEQGFNTSRLAGYLDEPAEKVENRIRKLYDIGALFTGTDRLPVVTSKISQFVSETAPTY